MEYTGGRTENDIVNWILKRVGPPSTEVSCDALKEKVEGVKLAVAYFGDLSAREYTEVFLDVAQNPTVQEKYQFYHTSDKDCASQYGASSTPSVVLFRNFDESPLVYKGNWETTPMVDWLVSSSVPILIEFSEEFIEPIFGQRKPALFLFRSKNDADSNYAKTF